MNQLLTSDNVKNIAGDNSQVITYNQLKTLNSLNDLDHNLILLYRHTPTTGHWVALIKHNKHLFEYFDSYGYPIDEPLKWIPSYKSNTNQKIQEGIKLGQNEPLLSKLILKYLDENPLNKVIYNEYKYQSSNTPNSSTCGRWVGYRIKNKKKSLQNFQNDWNKIKHNKDPDKVIIQKTKDFL